jgi:uncharacterized protein YuzB (UPF0349 family)
MSIELIDDNSELDVVEYECWYWSVIDSMAELVMNNGRDQVMSHVSEAVLHKIHIGYVVAKESEEPIP